MALNRDVSEMIGMLSKDLSAARVNLAEAERYLKSVHSVKNLHERLEMINETEKKMAHAIHKITEVSHHINHTLKERIHEVTEQEHAEEERKRLEIERRKDEMVRLRQEKKSHANEKHGFFSRK